MLDKALESLEKIKIGFGCDLGYYGLNKDYEIVEQALTKAQRQEKVLSIIKKKNVGTRALKYYIEVNEGIALNVYNSYVDGRDKQLTEEEYNLLKEEFKNV